MRHVILCHKYNNHRDHTVFSHMLLPSCYFNNIFTPTKQEIKQQKQQYIHTKYTPQVLTYLWSGALLEKLPIVQLLKNFPAFYGTRRFIIVFAKALHWYLF
jgi:hypothetical protein